MLLAVVEVCGRRVARAQSAAQGADAIQAREKNRAAFKQEQKHNTAT